MKGTMVNFMKQLLLCGAECNMGNTFRVSQIATRQEASEIRQNMKLGKY